MPFGYEERRHLFDDPYDIIFGALFMFPGKTGESC